ncbi:MAG: PocR ligand-binding domain-containing protein [Spirochaetota bacterium]
MSSEQTMPTGDNTQRYAAFLRSPRIKDLCIMFSRITGLVIDIDGADGVPIASFYDRAAENPFCRKLKQERSGFAACAACTARAFAHIRKTSAPYVYRCDFGLTEIVIPILIGKQFVCALLTGQFFTRAADRLRASEIHRMLRNTGQSPTELISLYRKTRILSPDTTNAIIDFLTLIFQQVLGDFEEKISHYEHYQEHAPVGRAVSYLKANFHSTIRLTDIAAHAGVSKFYFTRLFKEAMGFSVFEYITILRMTKAKDLLHTRSVLDTCYDVGYSSLSFFTRAFKKANGITPGQFQREINKSR